MKRNMKETMRKKTAALLATVLFSSVMGQSAWAVTDNRQTARPPIIEPVMENTTIVNGGFEKSVDGFGNPEGWNIEVSKSSGPGGSVSWSLSQEEDNVNNTSKKLTLYNGMDEEITFRVTQTVYGASYPAGNYTASVIYEGTAGDSDSGITFTVNGHSTGFGVLEGWQNWKQAVVPGIGIVPGQSVDISISGRLGVKEFLDLDDVELVLGEQFAARQFNAAPKEREHPPYEPVREAPALTAEDQIQNGEFTEDLCWDVYGYPKGYLPKWEMTMEDFNQWDYWIADGILELKNISDLGGMRSAAISQKVHLKPGKYLLHGETGWVWDAENEDGVCMRVADKNGVLIAERYWNPGYGRIISDEFVVKAEMDVTVSITVQLPQGATAALDGFQITESPKKITWNSAKQVGGVSGKKDTEKIRVTFSAPVFGLEEKHFIVDDAVVTKVSRDGGSAYLVELEDIAFANEKSIEVRMNTPEYYELDSRKKRVTVYRDTEEIPGLGNGGFTSGVDWNKENYPDGYIAGWSLPSAIDWDVWRYNITDGIFQLTNISENASKEKFTLHQVIALAKGTYSIKTNSPWTWDGENAEGIQIQVKEGKKLLTQVSGNPGTGVIQSDLFTIDEDTTVDCIITLSLPGGQAAALQYVSVLPTEDVRWESAVQLDGEPGSRTTERIELVFSQDMADLSEGNFRLNGAEVSKVTSLSNGKYQLEIHSLSVLDGEQVVISIDPPDGYKLEPSYYPVTVYVEEDSVYSAEVVNGDFSVGVDWSNPSYPDGYVEGWTLPSPFDWDTWRYATPDVFEVQNVGEKTADFVLEQETILPAGKYTLAAEIPYAWGDTENSGIWLQVSGEKERSAFAQAEGKAEPGTIETDLFTLKKATKVTITISMTVTPGSGVSIDNIRFKEDGEEPEMPDKPETPDEPDEPEVPDTPDEPDNPDQPDNPDNPDEPEPGEFTDPIINGDFTVGVDWDAGGTLEGWTIDPVDWDVWNSYSGGGGEWGNFWVIRGEAESDQPLSLRQEVELLPGTYGLKANSQGTWDAALTDAVTLRVEKGGEELASKAVQPGYGTFETNEFTLDEESTVEVIISFKLPASGEMGIDDVQIVQVGSDLAGENTAALEEEEEKEEEDQAEQEAPEKTESKPSAPASSSNAQRKTKGEESGKADKEENTARAAEPTDMPKARAQEKSKEKEGDES